MPVGLDDMLPTLREGARRDADGAGRAHWYRLAKAKRRCSKRRRARRVQAPLIASNRHSSPWTAWSNAEANDDDEHAVTIDAFLARLPPVGNDLATAATAVAAVARMWRQRKRTIYAREKAAQQKLQEEEEDEQSQVTVEELMAPGERPKTADIDTVLEKGLRSPSRRSRNGPKNWVQWPRWSTRRKRSGRPIGIAGDGREIYRFTRRGGTTSATRNGLLN